MSAENTQPQLTLTTAESHLAFFQIPDAGDDDAP